MLKVLTYLGFFLIFLSSCDRNVDPVFEEHLKEFKDDAKRLGIVIDDSKLTIKLVDSLPNAAGMGIYSPSGQLVLIVREVWNDIDSYGKKLLLYHELGHAILKRHIIHNNEMLDNGEPKSLMSSEAYPSYGFYEKNEYCYLYELFYQKRDYTTKDCDLWK
jgi:hypothetical protein